jgi:hypothetical protein
VSDSVTTLPGAPTMTSAVAGDQLVTLSWSPPTANGGSPITNYMVEQSTDAVGPWVEKTCDTALTSASRSCVASGLTNGQAYHFRVKATNAVGFGEPSPPVSATPVA